MHPATRQQRWGGLCIRWLRMHPWDGLHLVWCGVVCCRLCCRLCCVRCVECVWCLPLVRVVNLSNLSVLRQWSCQQRLPAASLGAQVWECKPDTECARSTGPLLAAFCQPWSSAGCWHVPTLTSVSVAPGCRLMLPGAWCLPCKGSMNSTGDRQVLCACTLKGALAVTMRCCTPAGIRCEQHVMLQSSTQAQWYCVCVGFG